MRGRIMQELKYIVYGIGIYIEYSNDKTWNAWIENKLQRELAAFSEQTGDESKIKQRVLFKNYSLIDSEPLDKGFVTPEHSIYKDGLFKGLNQKIAFRFEKDNLICWVGERSYLHLPYVLGFLFKQRNMMFIHAAAITMGNKGILLPACGGIGKTAFISEAIKDKRVKLLGDDFILLDNEGYLYPYPQPFALYSYHQVLFPEYFKKSKVKYVKPTLWNRGKRMLKSKLNISGNKVLNNSYIEVSPFLLLGKDKIADEKVPINSIYVLRRYRDSNLKHSRTDDVNGIANFCVGVTSYELYPIARMNFDILVRKEESVSSYYKTSEDIVRECLIKSDNKYFVDIPEDWDAQKVAKELSSLILSRKY